MIVTKKVPPSSLPVYWRGLPPGGDSFAFEVVSIAEV